MNKEKQTKILYSVFIILTLFVVSCNSCNSNKPKAIIMIEKAAEKVKPITLTYLRLEQDLKALKKGRDSTNINLLKKRYGKFLDIYFMRIINISKPNDIKLNFFLNQFYLFIQIFDRIHEIICQTNLINHIEHIDRCFFYKM